MGNRMNNSQRATSVQPKGKISLTYTAHNYLHFAIANIRLTLLSLVVILIHSTSV